MKKEVPSMKEEKKDDSRKEEFKFYEPKSMTEQKLDANFKKKYAISIWKVNRG